MEHKGDDPTGHILVDPGETQAVSLLRRLLTVVEERQQAMYGVSRNFEPAPSDPVHVLMIDELVALTAYADNETKAEASRLLSKILT